MNTYLFALIFAAYITGSVFIVLWMDRNYFNLISGGKASERKNF